MMMTKTNTAQNGRMVVAATMIPPRMRDAIDALAGVRLMDRSAWLREAVIEKLTAEGADIAALAGMRA